MLWVLSLMQRPEARILPGTYRCQMAQLFLDVPARVGQSHVMGFAERQRLCGNGGILAHLFRAFLGICRPSAVPCCPQCRIFCLGSSNCRTRNAFTRLPSSERPTVKMLLLSRRLLWNCCTSRN